MNQFDLNNEMQRNESDKQLAYAELEASRNKWAQYLINNKDEICTTLHPMVVKKKTKARVSDFINKIKMIFGLIPKKEEKDGIEAYLQYCDSVE